MDFGSAYVQVKKRAALLGLDTERLQFLDALVKMKNAYPPCGRNSFASFGNIELTLDPADSHYGSAMSRNKQRMNAMEKMGDELVRRYTAMYPKYEEGEIKESLTILYGASHSSPDKVNLKNKGDSLIDILAGQITQVLIKTERIPEFIEILREWMKDNDWTSRTISNYMCFVRTGGIATSVLRDILESSSPSTGDAYMLFTGFDIEVDSEKQEAAIKALSRILALIPQDKQDNAKEIYKKCHWEFADSLLEQTARLQSRTNRLSARTFSGVISAASQYHPLLATKDSDADAVKECIDNVSALMDAIQGRLILIVYGSDCFSPTATEQNPEFKRINKLLVRDKIEDPYNTLLGMYLAFKDDEDYPWMLNVSSGIAETIRTQCISSGPLEYEDYGDGDNDTEYTDPDPQWYREAVKVTPMFDYDLDESRVAAMTAGGMNECSHGAINVCRAITVGVHLDNKLKEDMTDVFIEQYAKSNGTQVLPVEESEAEEGSEDEQPLIGEADLAAALEEKEDAVSKVLQLEKTIAEQKAQIARLKDKYSRAQEITQNAKAEKEKTAAERDEAHRKMAQMEKVIADLREDAYDIASGEEDTQEDSPEAVELPYTPQHNIIIFGGHDSWLREIKPLLPGVRFYGNQASINADAIRGADGVYVQINKICHSSWYRIMEVCDNSGVPVKNFRHASAKLCAVDVARFDGELIKNIS